MFLTKFWILPDNPPENTDCFIVISYAVENKTSPNTPTKKVIELAYNWWKKIPKAFVITSTGDNQNLGVSNSRIMADYAYKLGIPREKIIEEDKSMNTFQNLLYSARIVKKRHFSDPTLVTLDLHLRRTLAIAKKLGWNKYFWVSTYSEGGISYGSKYLQTRTRFTIFIYEVLAYIYNLMLGQA